MFDGEYEVQHPSPLSSGSMQSVPKKMGDRAPWIRVLEVLQLANLNFPFLSLHASSMPPTSALLRTLTNFRLRSL